MGRINFITRVFEFVLRKTRNKKWYTIEKCVRLGANVETDRKERARAREADIKYYGIRIMSGKAGAEK